MPSNPTPPSIILAEYSYAVFILGCIMAIAATAICSYRVLTCSKEPITYTISAGAISIGTGFCMLLIWISCTILSPRENYFTPSFIAWMLIGVLPSTIIAMLGGKHKKDKESKALKNLNKIMPKETTTNPKQNKHL